MVILIDVINTLDNGSHSYLSIKQASKQSINQYSLVSKHHSYGHKLDELQGGGVVSVEGTRDGRLAFSGGRDGRVLAYDLR